MIASPETFPLQDLIEGKESAYRLLVDSYKDKVYNTCLGFLGNEPDAEDITQEVFIQVFQSVSKFRGESSLGTWVYRIAVTRSLDHIRSKKRKKRFAFLTSLFSDAGKTGAKTYSDFQHPGIAMEKQEKAAILAMAVGKLPENQRIAFTLHKIENLSYKEISEITGLSISAIESLMHRAKANLRKQLSRWYEKENE